MVLSLFSRGIAQLRPSQSRATSAVRKATSYVTPCNLLNHSFDIRYIWPFLQFCDCPSASGGGRSGWIWWLTRIRRRGRGRWQLRRWRQNLLHLWGCWTPLWGLRPRQQVLQLQRDGKPHYLSHLSRTHWYE